MGLNIFNKFIPLIITAICLFPFAFEYFIYKWQPKEKEILPEDLPGIKNLCLEKKYICCKYHDRYLKEEVEK